MQKRMSIVLSVILMLALLLSGCGSQENTADVEPGVQPEEAKQVYSGEEGRITVYISGPENMVSEMESKFEEGRGDVLNMFHTGCGSLRQKVWTEMEAGNIQADVIWGAEPLMYMALTEKDKLLQYKSPQAEALLPEYTTGDGYYTLVNARYGVIVYNKDRVKASEVPKAWADLVAYP